MNKFILLASLTGFAAFGAQPNPGDPYQDVQLKKIPAPHTRARSGPQMFKEYCAACHGLTGGGDGPAAPALKVAPPDLTSLKASNHGDFPSMKVAGILRGSDEISAHGSKEMPMWGPIFRSMEGGDSSMADLRIHNLTEYLKSIQK